jgi:PPIC-type PPIASE domain
LAVLLALGGCGGGSHDAAESSAATGDSVLSAGVPSDPGVVVVRTGGHVISQAAFAHAFAAAIKSEGPGAVVPVPPAFTACIKHLQASPGSSTSTASVATLKTECQQQYDAFAKQALDPLISQQWVIGGATEEGVSVSEAELDQAVNKDVRGETHAQAVRQLAAQGETWAQFVLRTKVQLLAEGIRGVFMKQTEHVTPAQILAYYDAHQSALGVPPRRGLEIARVASKAEALKVKREIASGKSFATVVKSLPLVQPIFSKNGLVSEYQSGLYHQTILNGAIFAAKPGVVSGPVQISLGFYVFEVTRLLPGVQVPLSQVQAGIQKQLAGELYKQAFSAYVASWRKRWRARTHCQPDYVVAKCSEGTPEPEDPFTLD